MPGGVKTQRGFLNGLAAILAVSFPRHVSSIEVSMPNTPRRNARDFDKAMHILVGRPGSERKR
jgi:hypothetical protein